MFRCGGKRNMVIVLVEVDGWLTLAASKWKVGRGESGFDGVKEAGEILWWARRGA